jgi:hypothetical protein
MLRPVPSLLLLPLLVMSSESSAASTASAPLARAAAAPVGPGVRLPLELEGKLEIKRSTGEPPFTVGEAYSCVFGRAGQFSLHMPPQDYHDLGVHTKGRGTATDADTLVCTVPRVVTAGNTTVCVMPPNATDTPCPAFRPMEDDRDQQRPADVAEGKHVTCGVTPCTHSECGSHFYSSTLWSIGLNKRTAVVRRCAEIL